MSRINPLGKTETIRVVLPIKLYERIIKAAYNDNRTISEFVRLFLDKHIDERR